MVIFPVRRVGQMKPPAQAELERGTLGLKIYCRLPVPRNESRYFFPKTSFSSAVV